MKSLPFAARSIVSYLRLGRGLGQALTHILTHTDYGPKSNEKRLISREIRRFLVETTELESVTSCV